MPISHNSHYDFLVDKNSLSKVQVKRAYKVNNHGTEVLCVESRRISGKARCEYPKNAYNYLVAVDVDANDIWIIPKLYADTYKAQIYLTSKMDEYKNNWKHISI